MIMKTKFSANVMHNVFTSKLAALEFCVRAIGSFRESAKSCLDMFCFNVINW